MNWKRKTLWAIAILAIALGSLLYIVPLFFPLTEGIVSSPPQGLLFVDRGRTAGATPCSTESFVPTIRRSLTNSLRFFIDATLAG